IEHSKGEYIAFIDGDDYISKPFRPRELVSRIRRVLRQRTSGNIIQLGNICIDSEKGSVTKNGEEIQLSALEYRILMLFATNRGILLSRERLLEEIWDIAGDFVNDNTLTVYIKRIREKIEDNPANPSIIKTVRGMGYRLD
ncbi:MAG TPA: response regulator transcription factor, partial [Bacillota bacterium]|nr:response regulator transcription factor [Bacillota bacterium]